MKKKLIMLMTSILLIVVCITILVACDDANDNDNDSKNSATKIELTEDMTAEEILNLIPQIESMAYEFQGRDNKNRLFTYRMEITNKGNVVKYIYGGYEENYAMFVDGNTIVFASKYFDDDGKEMHAKETTLMSDEEINEITNCLRDNINIIVNNINGGEEWRIENGTLVFTDYSSTEILDGEIKFKDFNVIEIDFAYYLSFPEYIVD